MRKLLLAALALVIVAAPIWYFIRPTTMSFRVLPSTDGPDIRHDADSIT
ncbi:hypothetical protein SAMN04488515_2641 [Cognatiyoonia koreensis]|uniref:Uncharacterized protein n=1 Tax=Cognatiyoonia koreensis TaxID=364200 RepID=A0A1I0RG35_9RHOB|nr:hypothetical protein SAMN04488515_2641 [Cognatiyoonia koreensis]